MAIKNVTADDIKVVQWLISAVYMAEIPDDTLFALIFINSSASCTMTLMKQPDFFGQLLHLLRVYTQECVNLKE